MPFHHELEEQIRNFILPFMLVNGVLGLLMVFVGYRIWTVFLALMGLSLGFLLGVILGAAAEPREPAVVFGIGALGALVGAGLLAGVRPLGTFVVGGSIAIGLVDVLLDATGGNRGIDQEAAIALAIIVFVVAGLIIAMTGRAGIIVASSFSGAQAVVGTGSVLVASEGNLERAVITPFTPIELAVIAGVAILGMAVQFGSTKDEKSDDGHRPEDSPAQNARHRDTRITAHNDGTAHGPGASKHSVTESVKARLAELGRLKDSGLITEEEYNTKRSVILSEI